MTTLRFIEQFESLDTLQLAEFPLVNYSWDHSQGLRAGTMSLSGVDYAARSIGLGVAAKSMGVEQITFWLTEEAEAIFSDLSSTCHQIGVGRLWSTDETTRHWCYASLIEMLETSRSRNLRHLAVRARFARFSDWLSEEAVTGTQDISASPTIFDITVNGPNKPRLAVLRLRADATSGFANTPTLENVRGTQSVAINQDAGSANDEIRIDCDRGAVEYSDDDGATYANIYDEVTLGDEQPTVMRLYPGTNPMTYSQSSGTPNATLEWEYYDAWNS